MMPQAGPLATDYERPKPVLLQIPLHGGSVNSARAGGVERALDLFHIGSGRAARSLALPVLDHHRNTGGAASVLLLPYEGNIQPDARRRGGKQYAAKATQGFAPPGQTWRRSVDGNNDENQSHDAEQNEEQVPI